MFRLGDATGHERSAIVTAVVDSCGWLRCASRPELDPKVGLVLRGLGAGHFL